MVAVLSAGLVVGCTPDEPEDIETPEVDPPSSSVDPSPGSLDPSPVFMPVDDLDPCPREDEMAGLDTVDYDGSFEYEGMFTGGEVNEGTADIRCGYEIWSLVEGNEIGASDGVFGEVSVQIVGEPESVEIEFQNAEVDFDPPEYFRSWKFEQSITEFIDGPTRLCDYSGFNIDDCRDDSQVSIADVYFTAWLGNLRVKVYLIMFTPDLERDVETWAGEVLTEITQMIVSRIPTEDVPSTGEGGSASEAEPTGD